MYRLLLFFVVVCSSLPAQANTHAREAFRLADKGNWVGAQAQAKKSGEPALEKLIFWQYTLDSGSGASFNEITNFIALNPEWPEQKRLRIRAEMALKAGTSGHDDMIGWFKANPPITGVGKISYARALLDASNEDNKKIETLIQEAWRDGDFDEIHEKDILNSFGTMLTEKIHQERTSRLLWEEKTAAAKRMLPLLSNDWDRLAEARISLISHKKLSLATLRVPDTLENDPGLLFDRLRRYAEKGEHSRVRKILLSLPKDAPYPERWWPYRETQVRMAIDEQDYALASDLLDSAGSLLGKEGADAAWLNGWLQLRFLNNPGKAYGLFTSMYEAVSFPVSRSRAAYWAARAAEAAGQSGNANSWYGKASDHPTTFYGQLAWHSYRGSSHLHFPSNPDTSGAKDAFESNDIAIAAKLSMRFDAPDLADKLLSFLAENGSSEQAALAADLAVRNGYPHLGVRTAKKALQKNIVLLDAGYPTPKTPGNIAVDRPFALAIARQESEFDAKAVSSAGARGLIQLMPKTAKETAKKLKLRFDKKRLFEPDYNLTLGTNYLARMVESYDGSYVMAIAAYNAGPGNVRKWVRQFGTPGNDFTNAIDWIEKIPFAETRNYVQRVLENLQVYRQLEKEERLLLAEDLVR
jgi:soluble lytic murein transglycosylase